MSSSQLLKHWPDMGLMQLEEQRQVHLKKSTINFNRTGTVCVKKLIMPIEKIRMEAWNNYGNSRAGSLKFLQSCP